MNDNAPRPVCLAAVLLSWGALPAQQEATTLSLLADRAAVVVSALATNRSDPTPDVLRLQFRTLEVLRGDPGPAFAVQEPAGRCCGRALDGLEPGVPSLLFLERRAGALVPLGGDRGVLPASAGALAHVRALLAAPAPQARAGLLLAALGDEEQRVRDDAALSLAAAAVLPATADAEARVLAALRRELAAASTTMPALVDLLVRLSPGAAAAELLPPCLDDPRRGVRDLLGAALSRLPAAMVLAQLDAVDAGGARPARIAELLLRMPGPATVPLLDRLLAARPSPQVALPIAEALLAAGVPGAQLAGRVPVEVLQVALRRLAAPRPFRFVHPGSKP